jgi:hypothetical protein
MQGKTSAEQFGGIEEPIRGAAELPGPDVPIKLGP